MVGVVCVYVETDTHTKVDTLTRVMPQKTKTLLTLIIINIINLLE